MTSTPKPIDKHEEPKQQAKVIDSARKPDNKQEAAAKPHATTNGSHVTHSEPKEKPAEKILNNNEPPKKEETIVEHVSQPVKAERATEPEVRVAPVAAKRASRGEQDVTDVDGKKADAETPEDGGEVSEELVVCDRELAP